MRMGFKIGFPYPRFKNLLGIDTHAMQSDLNAWTKHSLEIHRWLFCGWKTAPKG